jgi:protein-S-isoprenylcysteine O-methyltransferase Ste14
VTFIPKIFVALIIIFITGAVANFVKDFVGSFTQEQSWGNGATNAATAAVWLIGVFAALDQVQVAEDIVDTLFQAIVGSLALIMVIKFGVGGIWAARDRFWPAVYDKLGNATDDTTA